MEGLKLEEPSSLKISFYDEKFEEANVNGYKGFASNGGNLGIGAVEYEEILFDIVKDEKNFIFVQSIFLFPSFNIDRLKSMPIICKGSGCLLAISNAISAVPVATSKKVLLLMLPNWLTATLRQYLSYPTLRIRFRRSYLGATALNMAWI